MKLHSFFASLFILFTFCLTAIPSYASAQKSKEMIYNKSKKDSTVKITLGDNGDTIFWKKYKPEKTFKDFPVKERFTAKPDLQLDFSICTTGKRYITKTREGLTNGAVFAGHYAFASWGCGSNCESFAIIDLITGKVYSGPEAAGNGIEFHVDSKLIFLNPPDENGIYTTEYVGNIPIQYLWTGKEFKKLK